MVLERAILDKSRFKRMVKTEEWYLYRVQYSSSNQSAYNFDLNDDSSFGFLAKVNISLDDKLFTVASTHQEIHMKPQLIKAISLTKEEFERLLLMYARLNRNVVPKNMRKYLTLNQNPLFITVPILEDEIDMDKVMWYLSGSMPENANDIKVGCVVTSKHIGNQYYVTSLTSDRYPSKSILKDNLTYEEYFKRKYDIVLQEPNREMLTAKPCRILTRVRLNPQMLRQDTFHNEEVHLPPELVFVEPITLQMANQLQCIELLYYRLQQLMLMQDLDNKIKTNIFSMKADEGHSESFEQELIKLRRTPSIVDGGASMSKIDDVESLIDGTFCKRIVPSQSTEIDRLSERMAPLKLSNAKVPSNVKINQIEFINSNLNQNFGKSNFDISSELNQRLREELILNNEEYDTLLIMLRLQLENFTSSLQTNGSSKKKTNDKQKESKPMATIQNHNVKEGIAIDFNTWCLRPLRPEDNLINLYDLREALTPCAAYDLINLERYEIIGDAFLKFVVCNLIFFLCVDLDEGRMSSLKSHIVSNVNLFDCAKRRGLDQYIQATKTELYLNWLPSSYEFKEEVEDNVRRPFFKQEIRAKTVSDAIEAMIGASLVSNGFFATLLLMKWLGIPVDIPSQPLNPSSTMLNWLPALDLISTSNNPVEANAQVKKLYERAGFSTLEKKIDYKFHNKALIVKALTHQGYHDNTTTGSFETLEFLGDAVIDYLLTRFLYENKERMYSPGDISSIRCAIVNNAYFGVLATRLNLFRHFLLNDQVISRQLSGYVAYCEKEYQPGQLVIQDFIVLKDLKVVPLEQVKTPKLMGDLFESVVGAIYLDSGRDLNVVWKFLFRQIQVELTYFSQNIPINFINCSLELAPTGKFVSKPKPDNSSDESHVAFVVDGKEYLGSGCNRITSRLSAARNFIYQHVHKRDLKTKVNNK